MKTLLKRIVTSDGIELVGLLYEPDQASTTDAATSKEILVHVHGMGGNFYENTFLDAIAATLTARGIAFFAFNNRGCEAIKDLTQTIKETGKKKTVRIGNAFEKFEDCIQDIGAAVSAVESWGYNKIHLSGHSLGSPKVIYYMTETQDPRIASVLLLSPADMLGLVRTNPDRFKKDIQDAVAMVKAGKGADLMEQKVWDEYPMSAATYVSLFADDSKAGVLNFHNPSDRLPALGSIKQPLLAVMGRKDDSLVIPIEDMMNRIKAAAHSSARVETVILGDANHGYTKDEQKLADTILTFIS